MTVRFGQDVRVTTLTHRSGATTQYQGASDLRALVAELDDAEDAEHSDVAVAHPSGWALSAFPSGLVVWENVEADAPASHRSAVSRDEVARLFELLVSGDFEGITALAWQPGYGT
jgi:hypothetical protein